jgi:hypothetical protein
MNERKGRCYRRPPPETFETRTRVSSQHSFPRLAESLFLDVMRPKKIKRTRKGATRDEKEKSVKTEEGHWPQKGRKTE